ncbi:MAG: dGTP triphosphohydrolase [Chitinophagaceae bacterium]
MGESIINFSEIWERLFSSQRVGHKSNNIDIRSPYIRDYDRIIFSSNFRRLQNKTQVFPLPGPILVHNRLTHTLEVASVARSLGKIVGNKLDNKYQWKNQIKKKEALLFFYKEELQHVLATASLAHDIGNPPFGHAGEDAIRDFFEKHSYFLEGLTLSEQQDFLQYESNAMALHLMIHEPFELTYTSLASIVKYPCIAEKGFLENSLTYKKSGFLVVDKNFYKPIALQFGLCADSLIKRHPFVYLLEAADDICYNIIDLEDAHRLHIIDTTTLQELLMNIIDEFQINQQEKLKIQTTLKQHKDSNEHIGYLRAKVINLLINACANVFMEYESTILEGRMQVTLLDSLKAISIDNLKKKSTTIYTHQSTQYLEISGFKVLNELLNSLCEIYLDNKRVLSKRDHTIKRLLPITYDIENLNKYRIYRNKEVNNSEISYYQILIILEYITGMTDVYAVDLYKRLNGMDASFRFA